MNDFLNRVWLDNSIRDYIAVFSVILIAVLLKKFISRYIAGLFFRLIKRFWKNVEKKTFIDLLFQPLGIFLVILVSIISLHKLTYPQVLEIGIYRFTLKQIITAIGIIVFICTFIWLLLRLIDFTATVLGRKAALTPDQSDDQLIIFFKDFLKVIIIINGILMILHFAFDFDVRGLLTGLSIIGAAIALSLRESIENLVASFIIFFDKPFTTGDLVKVLNVTGTVERIGLRSTKIRTDQKTYVTVPNKQMVDTVLDNLSLRTQRKAELKLEIALNTSSVKIEKLIKGLENILANQSLQESIVNVLDITGQHFLVQADYFTAPVTIEEFKQIKQQINFGTIKLMEDLEIEIAGASTDLRINKTVN